MNKSAPRLFIVEGPDCTGKTTLAKELCRAFNGVYIHADGGPLIKTFHAYCANILDNAEVNLGHGMTVVLDRHWPSEVAYGMALRIEEKSDFHAGEHFARIQKMGGTYILCHSEKAIDRQMVNPDHKHPYSRMEYARVMAEYDILFTRLARDSIQLEHYNLEYHGKGSLSMQKFIAELP